MQEDFEQNNYIRLSTISQPILTYWQFCVAKQQGNQIQALLKNKYIITLTIKPTSLSSFNTLYAESICFLDSFPKGIFFRSICKSEIISVQICHCPSYSRESDFNQAASILYKSCGKKNYMYTSNSIIAFFILSTSKIIFIKSCNSLGNLELLPALTPNVFTSASS